MKKLFVIHPFLFAIFPILFLYSHNIGETSFYDTLLPATIVLSFSIFLLLLLKLVLKDNKKRGIVVSVFWILFFSYGHVYFSLKGLWQIANSLLGLFLMIIFCMLFMFSIFFIIRTRRDLHNFTNIFNIIAISLVVISIINIGTYKVKTRRDVKQIVKITQNIETNTIKYRKSGTLPDIYYIILDRYASMSTLEEIYNFDNSEFIDYLVNRGFYVASESRCNYPTTHMSLASSLNMEYLNYLTGKVREGSTDKNVVYRMLENYKVWRFLKSKGYKFVHFGTWWKPTSKNKYADMNFNRLLIPEFSMLLYKTTIFYPIGAAFGFDVEKEQWKRVLYKFDKLSEIPNIKKPTFVFAHFLLPHDPFVFDRNGNFVTRFEQKKNSTEVNYVNQLIFTNNKVKILIDELLSKSEVPPIIILQSDEGPDPHVNFEAVDKPRTLNATIRILNAYYLPGVGKDVLYKSITPVNSFRLIFNLYFGANFELLEDESYITEGGLYKFVNVTDKVRY